MRGIALLSAVLALARPHPAPAADDPRFLTLDYAAGPLFHVQTTPEASQTILFAPGEQVKSVIVSDPGAYQIGVTASGDGLTLKANGPSALAVVSVQTTQRAYQVELVPGGARPIPSIVRFSYAPAPGPIVPNVQPTEQVVGFAWRVSGSENLRPNAIRDDGSRTYIEWQRDQALPAVFAIGPTGKEEIVEGYIRGGALTIDRVYSELIFRIDKTMAKAKRTKEKRRRGK